MPKKGFIPNKLKPWIDARKKYKLSHAQIQMPPVLFTGDNYLGTEGTGYN